MGQKKHTHTEFMAFMGRIQRAMIRRLDTVDIADLPDYLDHSNRAADTLNAAVAAVYDTGHSWTEIGKSLGMTRQNARQRFGKHVNQGRGDTFATDPRE